MEEKLLDCLEMIRGKFHEIIDEEIDSILYDSETGEDGYDE